MKTEASGGVDGHAATITCGPMDDASAFHGSGQQDSPKRNPARSPQPSLNTGGDPDTRSAFEVVRAHVGPRE